MVKKRVMTDKPWRAPRQGDKEDMRCAFVEKYDETQHGVITMASWCFGCRFYVCKTCNTLHRWSGPAHDVSDHNPIEDKADDYAN